MVAKKRPFNRMLRTMSGGAATDVLTDDAPPEGVRYAYTQVIAFDDLNAVTSIQMKAGKDGIEREFNYVPVVQALERVYHTEIPIFVGRDEHLKVVFTGATSGDTLTVYLRGWEEDNAPA